MFKFRWAHRSDPPSPGEQQRLDALLDAEVRRVRSADPDTSRQWQYLQVALEQREKGTENRTARAGRSLVPRLAFAFATLLFLVATVVWLRHPSVTSYETGRGQQLAVTLADSTRISLNHTSELIVERRPAENARYVTLKGEAFFQVRRNGTPFIVQTDVGTVRVLGTEFNVRVRARDLVVAVVKGRVAVSSRNNGTDSTVVLTAGQIAACTNGSFPSTPAELPFTEYPGWTHGKFLLYRTDLASACREIEAQFDVTVRFENHRMETESITGAIDGRSADAALRTLALLTGKSVRQEDGGYVLY